MASIPRKPRAEFESAASANLLMAQAAVRDARSTSNCRDVPKILAVAAERVGRAIEAHKTAVSGQLGRKSGRMWASIRRVQRSVHDTMSLYTQGGCVNQDPYGGGRVSGLRKKRRRK